MKSFITNAVVVVACFCFFGCAQQSVNLGLSDKYQEDLRSLPVNEPLKPQTFKVYSPLKSKKRGGAVIGVCFLSSNGNNHFGSPCNRLSLTFTNVNNGETKVVKTEANGEFEVFLKDHGAYVLKPTDPGLRTEAEKVYIVPGTQVLIHICKKGECPVL